MERIYDTGILECGGTKLIVSFQDLALLMKTSEVVFLIKLLYVMMEILRFVLIAFACHSVFHPTQLFQKSNK